MADGSDATAQFLSLLQKNEYASRATRRSILKRARALLDKGADPRAKFGYLRALHLAARSHEHEVLALMLGRGASPLDNDDDGQPPLASAFELVNEDTDVERLDATVALLAAPGVNLAYRDYTGRGVLDKAVTCASPVTIRRLLALGASAVAAGPSGTPIEWVRSRLGGANAVERRRLEGVLAALEGREVVETRAGDPLVEALVRASKGMWAGETGAGDPSAIAREAIAASARALASVVDDWEDFAPYLRRAPRRAAALAEYAADVWDDEYGQRFREAWRGAGRVDAPADWRAHFITSFRET